MQDVTLTSSSAHMPPLQANVVQVISPAGSQPNPVCRHSLHDCGAHSRPSREGRVHGTISERDVPAQVSPEQAKSVQVRLAVPLASQKSSNPVQVSGAPQVVAAHSVPPVVRLQPSEPATGVPLPHAPSTQIRGVQVVVRVPDWSQVGWPSNSQVPNGAPQLVASHIVPSVSRSHGSTVIVIDGTQAPPAHSLTVQVTVRLPSSAHSPL